MFEHSDRIFLPLGPRLCLISLEHTEKGRVPVQNVGVYLCLVSLYYKCQKVHCEQVGTSLHAAHAHYNAPIDVAV